MMRVDGQIRLSASDLMRFMSCSHASFLDLERLHGRGPEPAEDSEDAALLQSYGDAHEAAHLASLRAQADVAEIDNGQPFEIAVEATIAALHRGPATIFQGALEGGAWGGWSDFLERVEVPSELGSFSYEVADTKLKRKPDPKHLLQLVLYSDLLTPLQGRAPENAHVLLGDGTRASFRLSEYADYARQARDRLEAFVTEPWPTRPIPCSTCELCRWRVHCASEWESEDSLFRIAGISRTQVAKLEAAGVSTMAGLSTWQDRVPRLAGPTLERLRLQARLQTARSEKGPHHELRPAVEGKGFDLLPKPANGDLFYDIEGDPYYREDNSDGLEYLHGVWDGKEFTALWAHNRAAERQSLLDLFDLFDARLSANPNAHIYHYAAYEITALRRLCTQYGVGEAQLDKWLRERRFCDLYAVVRGGVAASEKSYSIKDMEYLYGFERTGEVKTAGGSVVAYEKWRENADPEILQEIEDYNRLDCVSTEELRDWLVSVRPEGPWPEQAPPQEERHDEADQEAEELRTRLDDADLPEGRAELLFDLAQFHRREAKPAAWAVFDAAAKTSEELCEDMDCLGGLTSISAVEPDKSAQIRRYRYPAQETKIRAGKSAQILLGDDHATVTILEMNRRSRTLTIRITAGALGVNSLPDRLDLLPTFAIRADPIPAAIMAVVEDQIGPQANHVADEILSRAAPRMSVPSLLPVPDGEDPVVALQTTTQAMHNTVLPVQGPPGTGKTYVTARAILALVSKGNRVGVSSNSHEAIRNVLKGCIDALYKDDWPPTIENVSIARKGSRGEDPLASPYDRIGLVTKNDDPLLSTADVIGGTAWLFARSELANTFDYLFIDEAGQVSLANLIAMTNAARNIVLVGDPNQLPQVIQGAHPHPADLSCLDWMLGDATTVQGDRGLFLAETRRMHPDLCRYISDQYYEGRLTAHDSTIQQAVKADGLPKAGAFLVPVKHDGRAQECPEEIEAIRRSVETLISGTWTDRNGLTRPLVPSDIIVVAPYNVQVNELSDALPGIRVGTVDKFQGQEAPVALISMTASTAEETSRGLDFLLSRQRLNVAISRGKALSLVFASPRLCETPCATVEQMRLVNALCALPKWTMETGQ
ncbi:MULTISPECIES: TM0106 family RecB-like putative nuclease [unclassified Ruegeria]|uniref:TM0106 family RecB-like putative nuclease n=1 Tax=unclassified Ruegeria TaxID=2625375 RepID=UPI00149173E6|nr:MULTISPECIES: TM0106 family RecB-like putative nuclease [unclassified Ruegeria]NOD36637.1 TM0106 family RecB-like putative nuclease [Ruegeria sp. HKCCD7296]NOE43864.1 TM0106 family RecB-like putative nuclease [Ruegeria sp. HKCCD7319]